MKIISQKLNNLISLNDNVQIEYVEGNTKFAQTLTNIKDIYNIVTIKEYTCISNFGIYIPDITLEDKTRVRFVTDGELPSGIEIETDYFLKKIPEHPLYYYLVSDDTNEIPVEITTSGTGNHYVVPCFFIDNFSVILGWMLAKSSDYNAFPRYLQLPKWYFSIGDYIKFINLNTQVWNSWSPIIYLYFLKEDRNYRLEFAYDPPVDPFYLMFRLWDMTENAEHDTSVHNYGDGIVYKIDPNDSSAIKYSSQFITNNIIIISNNHPYFINDIVEFGSENLPAVLESGVKYKVIFVTENTFTVIRV
jgi:hypothetical protein